MRYPQRDQLHSKMYDCYQRLEKCKKDFARISEDRYSSARRRKELSLHHLEDVKKNQIVPYVLTR